MLRFVVLERRHGLYDGAKELRELLYRDWKSAWGREFTELGAKLGKDFTWRSDAFLRQDYIGALLEGDRTVCVNSYTLHDLSSEYERDKSYLRDTLTETSIRALRENGVESFVSFEFFNIMPEFRGGRRILEIFDFMVSMGLEFLHASLPASAAVTLTRNVKGINKYLARLGFRTVVADMTYNGEPADLMLYDHHARPAHRREDMERRIREMWDGHAEYLAFPRTAAMAGPTGAGEPETVSRGAGAGAGAAAGDRRA